MKKRSYIFLALLFIGGLIIYYLSSQSNDGLVQYDVRFPIDFIPYSNQPRTRVKIEDIEYRLLIDLGSPAYLTLREELLEKVQNKAPFRNRTIINLIGEEYPIQSYLIPKAKVWYLKIENFEIEEDSPGVQIYDSAKRPAADVVADVPGKIGRAVFINTGINLFMDFRNSAMFICNSLSYRKKDGYHLEKLVQFPFEMDRWQGIVWEVDTDLGTKRLLLDTGCSLNLIKPSIVKDQPCEEWLPGLQRYKSSKFVLGERDFGETNLTLSEMSPALGNFDGIIGMEFLEEHVVYLDFKKKIAYVGKSTECLDQNDACQMQLPYPVAPLIKESA